MHSQREGESHAVHRGQDCDDLPGVGCSLPEHAAAATSGYGRWGDAIRDLAHSAAGPCRFVRISGSHNDIALDIVPGGTIEITGAHNDVNWRQTEPGPRPDLQDHGESNTFYRVSTEP